MVMYVQERSPTGTMSRVVATTLFTYLQSQSATIKAQFGAMLPVDNIFPKTGLSAEQLKNYLDKPPSGRKLALTFNHSLLFNQLNMLYTLTFYILSLAHTGFKIMVLSM